MNVPPGQKAVSSKLVFRVKQDNIGAVECFKACLVAKGFSQVPGMDFDETFAPVVKLTSIRVLCALQSPLIFTSIILMSTQHFSMVLKEEIYMRLPQGVGPNSGKIIQLLHSIYGLKQASQVWNELLDHELGKLDFH